MNTEIPEWTPEYLQVAREAADGAVPERATDGADAVAIREVAAEVRALRYPACRRAASGTTRWGARGDRALDRPARQRHAVIGPTRPGSPHELPFFDVAFPAARPMSSTLGKSCAVGEPFQTSAPSAGCGGFVHHDWLAPTSCTAAPTVVGLKIGGKPGQRRALWRGFACDAHAAQLLAARALLPRDRDILARRRDEHRTQLAGRRWAGEHEGALARGQEADRLLALAQEWATRHPR